MTVARRRFMGEMMSWFTASSVALLLLLIVGLLGLIAWNGVAHFWPRGLIEFELTDGSRLAGELHESNDGAFGSGARMRIKTGNRDFTGSDFRWIPESEIALRENPKDLFLMERAEWGVFIGRITGLQKDGQPLARSPEEIGDTLPALLASKRAERERVEDFERRQIGDVNVAIEALRLRERALARADLPGDQKKQRLAVIEEELSVQIAHYEELAGALDRMRRALAAETLVIENVEGREKVIPAADVIRVLKPNEMGWRERFGVFASRGIEFLTDEPRESNTEGGVFPAIFGTVMMVLLMSVAVTPFGIIAAVYLREYAKEDFVVQLVRIAVNNLAGVPSIVFGVFGLGFFVYLMGGNIDRLFYSDALPSPTFGTGGILWGSLTLALLTVPVVIVATEEGLAAVPRAVREGSRALGATQFETLWRIVLPAAGPGILTGLVLAIGRAAGEVAPLMIVGVVKLAPSLPVDHHFPFVHLERKFMHLGFHIFDVGFQSPNVEAAKPLVFATALLLVGLVLLMNLTGIITRERLRRRYRTSAV